MPSTTRESGGLHEFNHHDKEELVTGTALAQVEGIGYYSLTLWGYIELNFLLSDTAKIEPILFSQGRRTNAL